MICDACAQPVADETVHLDGPVPYHPECCPCAEDGQLGLDAARCGCARCLGPGALRQVDDVETGGRL